MTKSGIDQSQIVNLSNGQSVNQSISGKTPLFAVFEKCEYDAISVAIMKWLNLYKGRSKSRSSPSFPIREALLEIAKQQGW